MLSSSVSQIYEYGAVGIDVSLTKVESFSPLINILTEDTPISSEA